MMRKIEKEALEQLANREITLRVFRRDTQIQLYGKTYQVPAHSEIAWFRSYLSDCLERGMTARDIIGLTRESYALLRYKQALTGSSDGSQLGATLAMTGHVQGNNAKEAYHAALREYDEKAA